MLTFSNRPTEQSRLPYAHNLTSLRLCSGKASSGIYIFKLIRSSIGHIKLGNMSHGSPGYNSDPLAKKKQSNQIAVFGQILSMGWPVIMIT